MTPTERAKKILEKLAPEPGYPWTNWIKDFVASEIAAAVAIAREEACADCSHVTREQFLDYAKQVRAEAYQDAAKIAEETYGEGDYGVEQWFKIIADKIRARAAEGK